MSLAQFINYKPNTDAVMTIKDIDADDCKVKGLLTFNRTNPEIKLTVNENNLSLLNSTIDLSSVKIISEQQQIINQQQQQINTLISKMHNLEDYIAHLSVFISNFKDIVYMEQSPGVEFNYNNLI
jgi:uncharacterized coiled-coil protein SlyX